MRLEAGVFEHSTAVDSESVSIYATVDRPVERHRPVGSRDNTVDGSTAIHRYATRGDLQLKPLGVLGGAQRAIDDQPTRELQQNRANDLHG